MLAQEPIIRTPRQDRTGVRPPAGGTDRQIGGTASMDSLQRRDKFADSITITFRYLDSTRNYRFDSSVNDFTKRYPVPATHIYLGNTGNASRSLLFSPSFNTGWDPGFHAFDVYKWLPGKVRFFTTTRPYTELNYLLGARVEQIIEVMHTQNIKPNWNGLFQYRLINSPGFFKNQKTNHNNYLVTSWFQSENKRYNNYFMYVRNKINSGENGGIRDDHNYLDDPVYKDRFNIETNIGGDPVFGRNFFSTDIPTGNNYSESLLLMRQQYDIGKKDSLVTDSLVIPLFFPRLRFEHTISHTKSKFRFADEAPDTAYYKNRYDITLPGPYDTFSIKENWVEIVNDFSMYQFPDAKNLQQFIKLGASLQNITGGLTQGKETFYNIIGHAEYRNKSRNQKWDIELRGKLFFAGLNSGNYHAYGSLQRFAGKKIGYIQVGYENVNRSPYFIFDSRSPFYLSQSAQDFKNENTSHFFGSFFHPGLKMKIAGHYYLLTNYTYIEKFYHLKQESSLFNVFRAELQKTIRVGRRWVWHTDIYLQQTIGDAPVNLPLIFTRNRFGYEGNLGFKNLDIAIGLEGKFHSPYKADNYSPVLGQFFYQDSIRISMKAPDISAYIHFRIRSFKAYVRWENLNTLRLNDGLNFTNNNLVAPAYPMPGGMLRLGIYWNFVN
jgi:hypothetical protein